MNTLQLSVCFAIAVLTSSAGAGRAQAQAGPAMHYDAISIHANKSDSGSMSIDSDNGSFVGTNVTLSQLLYNAYRIRGALTVGLPPWADSAHFDIRAKVLDASPEALKHQTDAQYRALTESLLEDRFGLKAHLVSKMLPVYELVVEKAGVKFKPHVFQAGESQEGSGGMSINNGKLVATGISMAALCFSLTGQVQRDVVDKTGLSGRYDLTLTWTPDRSLSGMDSGLADAPPPIYAALPEQLGLKLVAAKGPVDTLVIDHVELPTDN